MTGLLLLGVAAVALGVQLDTGDKGQPKSKVKVNATATKPDDQGRQTVTVTLDIEKPWYAYGNPVGNEEFEAAQTTVAIASKNKLESVKVEYPPAKEKKDPVIGTYRIYEDKVAIKALVQRAKGDAGPLQVTVKFMTCHPKGQCLPPETVKLEVK
jgi:thiol:disulfide interchange protein